MQNIVNGKIIKTELGTKDIPVFTCSLWIEMESGVCSFGGYALDTYNKEKGERVGTAIGFSAIMKLMEVLEVGNWEDLKGTYVRCKINADTSISHIGHLMKDKWFSFGVFFAENIGE